MVLQQLRARSECYAPELVPSSPSIYPSIDHTKYLNMKETSSNISTSIDATSISPWSPSHFIHDGPLIQIVGLLFNICDSSLKKQLNLIRKSCTEKGAWDDINLLIANFAHPSSFPGWQADFYSEEVNNDLRTHNLANLQQLMLHINQTNDKLGQSLRKNPHLLMRILS
ncbi:hypothetical protein O181_099463 [Austropuccinia psidii MF-1]|uniref:Uncharacterized protein n=1 Tax=Austropuccinia psidii MF-1 TaxID=1389203 RepID=A0A9Q3JB23_9BASI|nr:hypothetical protein [Austropuccinia psidii MF-1]